MVDVFCGWDSCVYHVAGWEFFPYHGDMGKATKRMDFQRYFHRERADFTRNNC
jgi:hypothetical protein